VSFIWAAPLALGLAVLIAGPIVAHLIRQTPKERYAFGAMLLLRRLPKRSRRRRQFSDIPLLLARILMILAMVFAVAGPEIQWPGAVPEYGGSGAVVVVIDDSLSMDLRGEQKGTLLARARSEAVDMIRALPASTQVGAVRLGGTASRLTAGLSTEHSKVVAALENVEQSLYGTDLVGGIRIARQMLAGQGGEVLVYTDEAGQGVIEEALSEIALLTEQGGALVPRPVHAESPANIAVLGAEYGSGPEGGTVTVRVANFGLEVMEVPATVSLPDGTEITGFVTMEPGQTVEKAFTVPRVAQGGVGTVRIEDGHLAGDDMGSFHLPTIGASRVLVIDGDPGLTPVASEVYYLERALAPWGRGTAMDSGVLPDITSPSAVDALDPDLHRVVFMANVADPGPWANRLVEFVSNGGSLIISLGDNVSAERTNAVLAALLPVELQRPRSLAALGEPGVRTQIPSVDQSIFAPFARGGIAGFRKVQWSRLFTVKPYSESETIQTLMRTEGGIPLLIQRRVGDGHVLLFTGSLDVDWSNFPLQSVYMPLIQSMVRVLGVPDGGEGQTLRGTVGQTIDLPISGVSGSIVVKGPAGLVETRTESGVLRFTPDRSGAYEVRVSGMPPLAVVAVNMDTAESDVRRHTSLARTAASVDPDRFMHRVHLNRWAFVVLLFIALVSVLWSWRLGVKKEVMDAS
jgi:hypothetical protein